MFETQKPPDMDDILEVSAVLAPVLMTTLILPEPFFVATDHLREIENRDEWRQTYAYSVRLLDRYGDS